MADALPGRHFAKLALAVTGVGWLGSGLGTVYWSLALDFWGVDSFFWIVLVEAGALAGVVGLRPGRSPVNLGAGPPPVG